MKIKISEATELYLELVGVKDDSGNVLHKGLLNERMDLYSKILLHELGKCVKVAMNQFTTLDEVDMEEKIEVHCDDLIDDILTEGLFEKIQSEIYCPTLFNVVYP